MSYSIDEIRVAANKGKLLPDMDVLERALWESLGFLYEEYRCGKETRQECEEAAKGYIELFVNRRKESLYDTRQR